MKQSLISSIQEFKANNTTKKGVISISESEMIEFKKLLLKNAPKVFKKETLDNILSLRMTTNKQKIEVILDIIRNSITNANDLNIKLNDALEKLNDALEKVDKVSRNNMAYKQYVSNLVTKNNVLKKQNKSYKTLTILCVTSIIIYVAINIII